MIKITMPQAGQTMEEGTILSWRKNEGEQVNKGEILFEIETDKANVEVEAPGSGILRRILCPQGTTVPVLAPIAILADPAEEVSREEAEAVAELRSLLGGTSPVPQSFAQKTAEQTPAVEKPTSSAPGEQMRESPAVRPSPPAGRLKASPLARKIALARGLDLGTVWPGSGPGGRILAADLERSAPAAPATTEPGRRPMSGMRRAIARNLLLSKQTIPHFYMRLTIDAAPLQDFSRVEKTKYPCSVTDVLTLACARVIREFPAFRSQLVGDDLVENPESNIGLAVGMEDGLRVPVLVGAERLSLRQVAEQARRVTEAAHQGKIEAMGRGVFTISNLGMYGVEEFSAIINPPEAAILAVGAIREAVIVKDGALRAGRVMTITLSADHRIIDGLLAARFMGRLKEVLESPEQLGS
jgi:pyruvate dehydrogenase E2 component (dihydrolipoamide acetyltransferase)